MRENLTFRTMIVLIWPPVLPLACHLTTMTIGLVESGKRAIIAASRLNRKGNPKGKVLRSLTFFILLPQNPSLSTLPFFHYTLLLLLSPSGKSTAQGCQGCQKGLQEMVSFFDLDRRREQTVGAPEKKIFSTTPATTNLLVQQGVSINKKGFVSFRLLTMGRQFTVKNQAKTIARERALCLAATCDPPPTPSKKPLVHSFHQSIPPLDWHDNIISNKYLHCQYHH